MLCRVCITSAICYQVPKGSWGKSCIYIWDWLLHVCCFLFSFAKCFRSLNSKVKYGKWEKEITLNPFLFSLLKQCAWASEGFQALWQVRGCRQAGCCHCLAHIIDQFIYGHTYMNWPSVCAWPPCVYVCVWTYALLKADMMRLQYSGIPTTWFVPHWRVVQTGGFYRLLASILKST